MNSTGAEQDEIILLRISRLSPPSPAKGVHGIIERDCFTESMGARNNLDASRREERMQTLRDRPLKMDRRGQANVKGSVLDPLPDSELERYQSVKTPKWLIVIALRRARIFASRSSRTDSVDVALRLNSKSESRCRCRSDRDT